jgi:diacylglycerol kinase family enzyme
LAGKHSETADWSPKAGTEGPQNPSLKNATLIYNPVAGVQPDGRSKKIQQAAAALRAAGIPVDLAATSRVGDATLLARQAVGSGSDLIVACGGDGTINEVINGMVPGKTPLAILPGGTANIAARELNIPGRIVKAARQIPRWSPHRIPLGCATWQCSGREQQRYFLSVAGIGFDASVIPRVHLDSKLRMGVLIYGWEAVRELLRYDFPAFRCSVDGHGYSATFAVLQHSLRYAGWLRLAPSHGLHSSGLGCCFFESSDRRRYLLYALSVLTHTHSLLPDVVQLADCRTVRAQAASPGASLAFELDGETVGELPATFEIVPEALTILAPRSVAAALA